MCKNPDQSHRQWWQGQPSPVITERMTQYVELPAQKQPRTLSEDSNLMAEMYNREIRAMWQASAISAEDKINLIIDMLEPRLCKEMKLHISSDDTEIMLAMLTHKGERSSLQELTTRFYNTKQNPLVSL